MGLTVSPTEPTTRATPPPPRRSARRRLRLLVPPLLWMLLGAALTIVAGLAAGAQLAPAQPAAAPAALTPSPTTIRLTARGTVMPIAHAIARTVAGGTVTRLSVAAGQMVGEQEELARVRGPNGDVEVISAPWRATVTAVPVNYGDTLTPGAVVAVIGDLSRLTVETTDVDEFIVGQIKAGQMVSLTVDALDRRTFTGTVRTVAMLPEQSEAGDDHYPVTVDIRGPTSDLQLGMTVRVNFAPS